MNGPTMRIDKWLWHARLVKTRSLAARLCLEGQVTIDGQIVERAARPVRPGAMLGLTHAGWRRDLEILALGVRRGPAPEASALYRLTRPAQKLSRGDPGWEPLLGSPDQAGDDDRIHA